MTKHGKIIWGIVGGVTIVLIFIFSTDYYDLLPKLAEDQRVKGKIDEMMAPSEDEPPKKSKYDGMYKGKSLTGACAFNFQIQVADKAVNGSAAGAGENSISCNLTLTGIVDDEGLVIGTATGAYTATVKDTPINWYMNGDFTWNLKSQMPLNMNIELTNTGNTCPPKTPCPGTPDTITATVNQL